MAGGGTTTGGVFATGGGTTTGGGQLTRLGGGTKSGGGFQTAFVFFSWACTASKANPEALRGHRTPFKDVIA